MTFVERYRSGSTVLSNRDGVPWWEAPIPRRWHRCRAQTMGQLDGTYVERCACGAIRGTTRFWFNRNSRRRQP